MQDLQHVVSFAKVVETGSFSRAAESLGVSKSAISKQIAALETSLGVCLLERTTRQLRVTAEGQALYEQCAQLEEQLQSIRSQAQGLRDQPQGLLRIAAPALLGKTALAAVMPEFLRRYPPIKIELSISEKIEDFFAGGFDIGIRIGEQQDATLAQQVLGMTESCVCATPEYLEENGYPIQPQDLAKHNCLLWQPRERMVWREWLLDKQGKTHRVTVRGNFVSNDSLALREAVLNHGGIALLPVYAVQQDLQTGKLIRVMDDYQALTFPLTLVYSHRQALSPKLRVFIEFVREAFALWLK